jgi:hypothetical protein
MIDLLDFMFPDHKGHMVGAVLPTVTDNNTIAYTCPCGTPLKLVRPNRLCDWSVSDSADGCKPIVMSRAHWRFSFTYEDVARAANVAVSTVKRHHTLYKTRREGIGDGLNMADFVSVWWWIWKMRDRPRRRRR